MKDFAMVCVFLAPSCICTAGAVYLASAGVAGWGWFLLVAAILGSVKYSSDDKKVSGP